MIANPFARPEIAPLIPLASTPPRCGCARSQLDDDRLSDERMIGSSSDGLVPNTAWYGDSRNQVLTALLFSVAKSAP